jgi:hypothetical protein
MSDPYVKKPAAVLDYIWDWTDWLTTTETIASATVTPAAGLTLDSHSETTTAVTAWFSGGTAGKYYLATCHVVSNQGRADDRDLVIFCSEFYGDSRSVAALTRTYTNAGSYDSTTNPTLASVDKWLIDVSATVDVALAAAGFAIPITDVRTRLALDSFVNEAVADLCHAANSTGRFFTEKAVERGVSPMRAIRKEIFDWVQEIAPGLEALGATRTTSLLGGIAFRETDQSGAAVTPIFERKAFGDTRQEWDQ